MWMLVTALPILFSLIRYVTETKQFHSISMLYLDSKDEPADPNIVYEDPGDKASS